MNLSNPSIEVKIYQSYFINTSGYPHLSSLLGPTHTRPPCRGEGLLQERWRSSKPVPQVVLHCPHDDQGVQPPFLWQQTHGKVLATYVTLVPKPVLLFTSAFSVILSQALL